MFDIVWGAVALTGAFAYLVIGSAVFHSRSGRIRDWKCNDHYQHKRAVNTCSNDCANEGCRGVSCHKGRECPALTTAKANAAVLRYTFAFLWPMALVGLFAWRTGKRAAKLGQWGVRQPLRLGQKLVEGVEGAGVGEAGAGVRRQPDYVKIAEMEKELGISE